MSQDFSKTSKYKGQNIYDLDEIIIPNRPPYVFYGTGKTGKTTAATEVIRSYYDSITSLYFITTSYDSPNNEYLRSTLPKICAKTLDITGLSEFYIDAKLKAEKYSRNVNINTVYDFVDKYKNNVMEFKYLIAKIDNITAELYDEKRIASDKIKTDDIVKAAKLVVCNEAFKIISEKRNQILGIVEQEDIEKVMYFCSNPFLPMLIFDDVSDQIGSAGLKISGKVKMASDDNGTKSFDDVSAAAALKNLIRTLCIKWRHAGGGICLIFLHNMKDMDINDRENVAGAIVSTKASYEELTGRFSHNDKSMDKKKLKETWDTIEELNLKTGEKYIFKLVYYANKEMSPDKKSQCVIMRVNKTGDEHDQFYKKVGTNTYRAYLDLLTEEKTEIDRRVSMENNIIAPEHIQQFVQVQQENPYDRPPTPQSLGFLTGNMDNITEDDVNF